MRVLIVGGAGEMGQVACSTIAADGSVTSLVVADRDGAAADRTAQDLGGIALTLDVTDAAAAEQVAADLVARHGAPQILVNNAGIVQNGASLLIDLADWRRVIDVNLHGVFHTARAFGRHMVAAGQGSVVNISSICG